MLTSSRYNINEIISLFFHSILVHLDEYLEEYPNLSRSINENKKNIKLIMEKPRLYTNAVNRAQNNLYISTIGFRNKQGYNLYDMFYEMLGLMDRYFSCVPEKDRSAIQYEIEQLYYKWCYEMSSKKYKDERAYYKNMFCCRGRMMAYNIMKSVSR